MAIEIITRSISTKIWDRVAIEFATPGVRHVSEVSYVTDCATRPGRLILDRYEMGLVTRNPDTASFKPVSSAIETS